MFFLLKIPSVVAGDILVVPCGHGEILLVQLCKDRYPVMVKAG